jgi:SNF2 family DNA or RNA helicase
MAELKLYPYQEAGVAFLKNKKVALLADEMGLGKSAQVIRALRTPSVLIICPAIARLNWKREFKKFGNPTWKPFVVEKASDLTNWNQKDPLIVSYHFAPQILKTGFSFDALILDEVHYLKNRKSVRTKAIFGAEGLCHRALVIWGLSGTPMPNHAGELWPILRVFGATKLPYYDFVKKFCNCTGGFQHGRYAPLIIAGSKKRAIPELRILLKKIMIRRRAKDVLDLPPIRYGEIFIEKKKYLADDLLETFDKEKLKEENAFLKEQLKLNTDALAFSASSISTLRRYTGLMKVEQVSELVDSELDIGLYDKIVIFCIHRQVVKGLRRRLWKYHPLTLHGGDAASIRMSNIDRFNTRKENKVMIANITAAGTAINLTSCSQVLFLEQDFVPGSNAQAIKRCHRIGQTEKVFVRVANLTKSLDGRVNEILMRKTKDIILTFEGENHANDSKRGNPRGINSESQTNG